MENEKFMGLDTFFVGAGAIGSFYSSRLKKLGVSVGIQSSHAETMSKNGIFVKSLGDDYLFVSDFSCKDIPKQSVSDIVFITTKVLKGSSTPRDIKPLIGKNTVIVLLQNGIGIENEYSELYPNTTIISGLAFICVSRISPTHIVHQRFAQLDVS